MTDLLDEATLFAALAESLEPESAAPDAAAIEALHRALERRAGDAVAAATGSDDAGSGPLAPVVPLTSTGRWGQRGGPLHRLRHPVAAAVAVAVLATSGVAAAAVATDHLPGPTRAVAYDLGLPVTSPALAATRETLAELQAALATGDVVRTRSSADLLRAELAALSPSDRASIQASAAGTLARADALVPTAAGATGVATGSAATDSGGATPAAGGDGASGNSSSGGPDGGGAGAAPGAAGAGSGPVGGTTATTVPRSDDGSTGTAPGSDDGGSDGGGSDDGSGSTTTTTSPGATTTTTRPDRSDAGGSDAGGSDDGSGSTDDAVVSTTTTLPGA